VVVRDRVPDVDRAAKVLDRVVQRGVRLHVVDHGLAADRIQRDSVSLVGRGEPGPAPFGDDEPEHAARIGDIVSAEVAGRGFAVVLVSTATLAPSNRRTGRSVGEVRDRVAVDDETAPRALGARAGPPTGKRDRLRQGAIRNEKPVPRNYERTGVADDPGPW